MLRDLDIASAVCSSRLGIDPWDLDSLQPASYDVHLGSEIIFQSLFIDRRDLDPYREQCAEDWDSIVMTDDGVRLATSDFALGVTVEHLRIPADMACRFEGKSSLGRLGLMTHVTAGFIDPGFEGYLTVELSVVGRVGVHLYPGMPIGQLSFYPLTGAAVEPYGSTSCGSHYQGQSGPQVSKALRRRKELLCRS